MDADEALLVEPAVDRVRGSAAEPPVFVDAPGTPAGFAGGT